MELRACAGGGLSAASLRRRVAPSTALLLAHLAPGASPGVERSPAVQLAVTSDESVAFGSTPRFPNPSLSQNPRSVHNRIEIPMCRPPAHVNSSSSPAALLPPRRPRRAPIAAVLSTRRHAGPFRVGIPRWDPSPRPSKLVRLRKTSRAHATRSLPLVLLTTHRCGGASSV